MECRIVVARRLAGTVPGVRPAALEGIWPARAGASRRVERRGVRRRGVSERNPLAQLRRRIDAGVVLSSLALEAFAAAAAAAAVVRVGAARARRCAVAHEGGHPHVVWVLE